jgi:hypothetical protein
MLSKLVLITLECVTEDARANAFLHDGNINVPVTLYKTAMRHRPAAVDTVHSGHLVGPLLGV